MKLHEFLESMYHDFHLHGYSGDAAWLLVRSLICHIFLHLTEARTGARNPGVGDNQKLTTKVIWAVLKTQVRMKKLMEHGFKDHPMVTGKIGHFMLRNSNLTDVNKLSTDVATLKGDVLMLKTKQTSSTKVLDQHATDLAALKKKVK